MSRRNQSRIRDNPRAPSCGIALLKINGNAPQCEVHSKALMAIDEKRDRPREMIEGMIPTKVTKRRDGTVEAVFDMLGALVADAKMAGEFDGSAAVKEREIKLEFEMYHRNPPNPPREWLKRGLGMPDVVEESSRNTESYRRGGS
jgi:hypothetical protein